MPKISVPTAVRTRGITTIGISFISWSDPSSKNALYTTGRKYAAFRMEPMRIKERIKKLPASALPRARYHLLEKPASGGIPIMDKDAIAKDAMVQGIFLPIPLSSLTFVLRDEA